jgi:hypothetical protein
LSDGSYEQALPYVLESARFEMFPGPIAAKYGTSKAATKKTWAIINAVNLRAVLSNIPARSPTKTIAE